MAAFKLPCLSLKKRRRQLSLPEFRWNSIGLKEEIGSGTFGTVYLAKCTDEGQCVVKKVKGRLQTPNDVLRRKPLSPVPELSFIYPPPYSGSAPIWGRVDKGEFRNWTRSRYIV